MISLRVMSAFSRDGESVVVVEVDTDQEDEIVASLVWRTEGQVIEDREVVQAQVVALDAHSSKILRFALPKSPPSYEGHLFSISWQVEVRSTKSSQSEQFILPLPSMRT